MISCNGIAARSSAELRQARNRLRLDGRYKFMMPVIDAAAHRDLDFGLITEPDGLLDFSGSGAKGGRRIIAIGATTPTGELGVQPSAWAIVRHMRETPPGFVLVDTVGEREGWATIVRHIAEWNFAVIVLCGRAAAPAWQTELSDIAPVRLLAPAG